MPDAKKDSTGSSQPPFNKRPAESATDERLERDADEMAEKAQNDEKRYDEDHDIFTK